MRKVITKNTKDLIELVLIPGIAFFLPWSISIRIFRWLAFHQDYLYRETVNTALAQARQHLDIAEEKTWLAERRLVTLIDHADMYLSIRHGEKYLLHHVDIEGQWPSADEPAIAVTFHWGAGMWALYHARTTGLHPKGLVAPLDRHSEYFQNRPILYHYIKQRTRQVEKALGSSAVDVSKSLKPIIQNLKEKKQIFFVADVPSDQADSSIKVHFLEKNASVPKALFKLGAERNIHFAYYICGINLLNGKRFIRIENIGKIQTPEEISNICFQKLDGLIQEKSSAWHLWDQAPRFFRT